MRSAAWLLARLARTMSNAVCTAPAFAGAFFYIFLVFGGAIMKTTNTNKRIDQQIFKDTADRVKKVNINPYVSRGGIRL